MSIRKIGEKLREGIELTEEEKLEFDNFREAHNIIIKLFTIELKKVNFSTFLPSKKSKFFNFLLNLK